MARNVDEFRKEFNETINSIPKALGWKATLNTAEELFHHYKGNASLAASTYTAFMEKFSIKRGGKLNGHYVIKAMLNRNPKDNPTKDEDFPIFVCEHFYNSLSPKNYALRNTFTNLGNPCRFFACLSCQGRISSR